jgi:hypothetical protein
MEWLSDPQAWAALGVAQARAQRIPEAIAATQRALTLASAQGNSSLADQMQTQLSTLLNPSSQSPNTSRP